MIRTIEHLHDLSLDIFLLRIVYSRVKLRLESQPGHRTTYLEEAEHGLVDFARRWRSVLFNIVTLL